MRPMPNSCSPDLDAATLYLRTDFEAEAGRLVAVDLDAFQETGQVSWQEVIAESEHTLLEARSAGDGFILVYLADAQPLIFQVGLDGSSAQPVDVVEVRVVGLNAKRGDTEAFVGLSSVTSPTESYLIEARSAAVTSLAELVQPAEEAFVPPQIVVERLTATSKDGASVPYFLVSPADADRSRPQPTLLVRIWGFKIPVLRGLSPWLALLACRRWTAGDRQPARWGEFGTAWYEAGRLAHKQNVFDDFVAVADHLKQTGVTTTQQLALHGRSNGACLSEPC